MFAKKHIIPLLSALLLVVALPNTARGQFYSMRINGLALLTGTINVGAGISLNKKTSLDLALMGNPIKTDNFSLQFAAFQPGARFWLSQTNYAHFFGIHLTAAYYNVANTDYRYEGLTAGLGFSWGYAWLISKRMNIAIELGASVLYMSDKKQAVYTPPAQDLYIYHGRRIAVAPTKCEVSFVYLF